MTKTKQIVLDSIFSLKDVNDVFLSLIAPPGWGKTSLLFDLLKTKTKPDEKYNNIHIVFISPLLAINDEVFRRFVKFHAYKPSITKKSSRNSINIKEEYKAFFRHNRSILISTAESINIEYIQQYSRLYNTKILWVLDEFHLFYIWGNSFRPKLLETLEKIMMLDFMIITFSATINENVWQWMNSIVKLNQSLFINLDLGNLTLLNKPTQEISFASLFGIKMLNKGKRLLKNRLKYKILKLAKFPAKKIIIFCQYRQEVEEWLYFCDQNNILSLGCRGGETQHFLNDLSLFKEVQVIVSTIALSHGVNLPSVDSIWITYPVAAQDIFLQMVARAGRRGEKYCVYSLQNLQNKNNFFLSFKLLLYDLLLGLCKIRLRELF